jgi:hypothetical protein
VCGKSWDEFLGHQTQGGDDVKGKILRLGLIFALLVSLLALGAITSGVLIAGKDSDKYCRGEDSDKYCRGEDSDKYCRGEDSDKYCRGEDSDKYCRGEDSDKYCRGEDSDKYCRGEDSDGIFCRCGDGKGGGWPDIC